MVKILSILAIGFFSGNIMAQSVISFSGGELSSKNMALSFSAGEVVSGNFSSESMNLSGGFSNGEDFVATSNEKLIDDLPKVFKLNQNYPNPFNPSTNIVYDLPKTSNVRLEIYNSIGAKVAVLADDRKVAGTHTIRFDASHLASGMYFYRLTADNNIIATKKMILIK